ncbi:MAG: ATP synthase subunit I [Candidatus Ozemobacteraceae bacterium]
MNELLSLVTALAIGVTFGAMFFAGLWWTVRQGLSSEYPALWFITSLLLRTSIALTGFYCAASGSRNKLLVCLFGFFVTHLIVIWLAQTAGRKSILTQEV